MAPTRCHPSPRFKRTKKQAAATTKSKKRGENQQCCVVRPLFGPLSSSSPPSCPSLSAIRIIPPPPHLSSPPPSPMKCFHSPAVPRDDAPPRVPWACSLSRADPRPHHNQMGPTHLRAFRYAELKAATRGFSRSLVIGEGGFGCVYRGVVRAVGPTGELEGPVQVAVKRLDHSGQQGYEEWITEVNFLSIVKHPNLVKLIGFCAEEDERGIQRLLVYEFMPNKSLEDQLLRRVRSLSWPLRLRIAQDAARGLAYLHEEMDFQLIFRDFKPANILLDENFNAKLSDFGLAREAPAEGHDRIITPVVGTIGYAAPEYVHSGRLTAKSDVWSFGVVLYELITGRRSIDGNLPRNEQKLLDWVKPYATNPKRLHFIMDSQLEGQYCLKSAQNLVAIANKCLARQPKCRPKMSEVVVRLDQILELSQNSRFHERARAVNADAHSRSKIFDLKELMSLRNRSVRRVDWRMLTHGRRGHGDDYSVWI